MLPLLARLFGVLPLPRDVAWGFLVFAAACLTVGGLVTGLWGLAPLPASESQDSRANIETFIFDGVTGLGLIFYTCAGYMNHSRLI